MTLSKILSLVIAIAIGLARICGLKGEIFQAFAHVTVGVLFGYGIGKPSHFVLSLGLIVVGIELIMVVYEAICESRRRHPDT